MPIIEIRALPQKQTVSLKKVISKLNKDLATACGYGPKHVWITWTNIEPGLYFEGRDSAPLQPKDSHPPLVNVMAFGKKQDLEIGLMLKTVSESLSDSLSLGGNVFVRYTELKPGRLASGGEIVK